MHAPRSGGPHPSQAVDTEPVADDTASRKRGHSSHDEGAESDTERCVKRHISQLGNDVEVGPTVKDSIAESAGKL